MDQFWDDFARWAKKPYDPSGSVLDWTLFVGLILILAFFWSRAIARILG